MCVSIFKMSENSLKGKGSKIFYKGGENMRLITWNEFGKEITYG